MRYTEAVSSPAGYSVPGGRALRALVATPSWQNHDSRSQRLLRTFRRFVRDPGLCAGTRHDPHHRYAFSFSGLGGADIKLADQVGKPILVVNTASLCGYTPQYAGLQQLSARYQMRGLMIVVACKRSGNIGEESG